MNCNLCPETLPEEFMRPVATTFHFWMYLCPRCTEKYGLRDDAGKLIYKPDPKGK